MGTKVYPLDEQDTAQMDTVRAVLRQARLDLGAKPQELSIQAGRNYEFVRTLERPGGAVPLASSLQVWGHVLNLRIEFDVLNLWRFAHYDPEFALEHRLSRPWSAHAQARRFLVSSLRQFRIARFLDVETVAPAMGVAGESVRNWEQESVDPSLSRAMATARVLGTRVQFSVFTKDEWIFG